MEFTMKAIAFVLGLLIGFALASVGQIVNIPDMNPAFIGLVFGTILAVLA